MINRMEISKHFYFTVITAMVILTAIAAWSYNRFGSFSNTLAYTQGERLLVDSSRKYVKLDVEDEQGSVEFILTNHSSASIQILGTSSSCTCTTSDSTPIEIPVGEQRSLRVSVRRKPVGPIDETLYLITNQPGGQMVKLEIMEQMQDETNSPPTKTSREG